MSNAISTKRLSFVILILISVLLLTCQDDISGNKNENQPPNTSLFIEAQDTLNSTASIQTFYWDGQDPDGFIIGFYYAFGSVPTESDWILTTQRKMTFPLIITGQDTTYIFQVKAVDNEGLVDPTPAIQSFPIINSAPQINWQINSNIPDTTFTVASFSWEASDLDGESSIVGFDYSIDDTITWTRISGDKRTLTLYASEGITPGDHAFYIRAVDIAGSFSKIIRMPENETKFWNVKAPAGRYLLIDDYAIESSSSGFPDRYYKTMLNNLLSQLGESFSTWDIERQFPASATQFTETLLLFDRIIWYTDLVTVGDPHFIAAQIALPDFLNPPNNGKIIFTTQFNNAGFTSQGNPLAFSPVGSLGNPFNVITTNSLYYPDSTFSDIFPAIALPELRVSKLFVGAIGLIPKATSVPMYRYDVANNTNDPIFIMVGKNDNKANDPYDFVFSGTPMHFLNSNDNLDDLFRIILRDIF